LILLGPDLNPRTLVFRAEKIAPNEDEANKQENEMWEIMMFHDSGGLGMIADL